MIKKFSTYNIAFEQNKKRISSEEIKDMLLEDIEKKKDYRIIKKCKTLDYLNENFTGWIKKIDPNKERENGNIGGFQIYSPYYRDPEEEFHKIVSYNDIYVFPAKTDFIINYTIDSKSIKTNKGRKTYNFKPQNLQFWIGESMGSFIIIKLDEIDKEKIKSFDPYQEEDWSDIF